MKKGAWIRVAVWVEGEDEPARDFTSMAIEAVIKSVRLVVPPQFQKLRIEVRSVYEDPEPPEGRRP